MSICSFRFASHVLNVIYIRNSQLNAYPSSEILARFSPIVVVSHVGHAVRKFVINLLPGTARESLVLPIMKEYKRKYDNSS